MDKTEAYKSEVSRKSLKNCHWWSGNDIRNVHNSNQLINRTIKTVLKEASEDRQSHSFISRKQSLTASESSFSSSQYSPPLSSSYEKRTTYWSIQRGEFKKKKCQLNL